jgi:zinc transporter
MSEGTGLVHAFILDGKGGARAVGWPAIRSWEPSQGVLWVHLDYAHTDALRWFQEESGVDPLLREALLAKDPRPRSVIQAEALLLIVRGVNLNQGAEPHDMVSLRLFCDGRRVISLRHRNIRAIKSLVHEMEAGRAPLDAGALVFAAVDLVVDRIGQVSDALDDEVMRLEDEVLSASSPALRARLSDLRRQAIALRRYIAPQRDVLGRLRSEEIRWMDDADRGRLREVSDRMTRIVEDLDAARERAAVTSEELAGRLSEQSNQRLYMLSMVTAVFLPLGLVTSVFGVNLGGIPGTRFDYGFWVLIGTLVAASATQLLLFKRRGWL